METPPIDDQTTLTRAQINNLRQKSVEFRKSVTPS